jgi:hypothetical protein
MREEHFSEFQDSTLQQKINRISASLYSPEIKIDTFEFDKFKRKLDVAPIVFSLNDVV